MSARTAQEVTELVGGYLQEMDIPWELGGRSGELVLTLPGEKKLRTVCSVMVGEQAMSLSAFVIRRPDENHAEFYRALLRRNLRMPGLAYAVDRTGDVYVSGRIPLAGVDADSLDQLLGVVLDACDNAFNDLLVIGFLTSMRREWAWRISRGESTANLEAFRHLLDEGSTQRQ